jgi:hypothetical protein
MRNVGSAADLGRLLLSPLGMGVLVAATGLLTWVTLSVVGGLAAGDAEFRLREAWDTSLYFYVGLPLMTAAVALASFIRPRRPWRWPLWMVLGHQTGVMLVGIGMQSGLSLILLTFVLAILLATFFAIPALLGSMAARALMERAY